MLLSLTSKDFKANSLVFPSAITSDSQLPDWTNIKYRKSVTEYGKLKYRMSQISIINDYILETYNETRYYFDNFSNSKMFSAALYGKVLDLNFK